MHGRNCARYRAGSASIEFAAGLAAFVLILALTLQGAVVIATHMTAVQAAREGARAAATLPPGDAHAAVARVAAAYRRQVAVHYAGDSVTVAVRLDVPVVVQGAAQVLPATAEARATMRRER